MEWHDAARVNPGATDVDCLAGQVKYRCCDSTELCSGIVRLFEEAFKTGIPLLKWRENPENWVDDVESGLALPMFNYCVVRVLIKESRGVSGGGISQPGESELGEKRKTSSRRPLLKAYRTGVACQQGFSDVHLRVQTRS